MNVKVDFIKQEQALEPEFKEMQPVPGGNQPYTLPVATPEILGGVKPVAKTEGMTQNVGVDETGGLWTTPSEGGGSGGEKPWILIAEGTLTEDVASFYISKDLNGNPLEITEFLRIEAIIHAPSTATGNSTLRVFFNNNWQAECWDFQQAIFKGTAIPISLQREYSSGWTMPEVNAIRFGNFTQASNTSPTGVAPKVIEQIVFFGQGGAIIGANTTYRIYTK